MVTPEIHESTWNWWKHGVIYHIYPRSFFDSNGDGIGDLRGVIFKVKYLADLGIDAIWLSPIYTSPNFDFGYDVSDYRGINPEYGSMADFHELLETCHGSGIRVIMDMILNHTSSLHPWFLESRAQQSNPKRDWYIWKDGTGNHPPNNWKAAFGSSAWQFDAKTGQYYLHSFFREQPDLNWRNSEMAKAVFEEMKFWLNLGVDGFRLDAINLIVKDKKFRNNPILPGIPFIHKNIYFRNRPKSIKIASKLRQLLDTYAERAAVGEIITLPPGDPEVSASYLADGEGIHLAFDFSLIFSTWNAWKYYKCISSWYQRIPEQGWPCQVLSNHDLFRHIDRFSWRRHKLEKAKVAAFLLLTLKGTPFIYYGEEIGMKNGRISRKQIRDPLGHKYWPLFTGRDRARTPMQWSSQPNAGFSSENPWLPVNPDYNQINVEKQALETGSLLNLYRSLIRLRRKHIALRDGRWIPLLNGMKGILAYIRKTEEEQLIVILNFTANKKRIRLQEHVFGKVLLSTSRKTGDTTTLHEFMLDPYEATLFDITMNSENFGL